VLAGEWEPSRIALRKPDEYGDLQLELRLGVTATGLDVDGRAVLVGSERLAFDGLVIATGATPRRLPGQPELDGVVLLRTLDDSLALRDRLAGSPVRLVVIGAGFIGMEVAATARGQGHDVTVLEALAAPLVRGLGTEMGHALAQVHVRHGVHLRLGAAVEGFVGTSVVEGVRLAGGELLPADIVLVGVGVRPATDWLEGSGLVLRDGVVCDATLSAGPAGIYAVGDVARWPHALLGHDVRIEHWTNAAEQGAAAARNLLATAAGLPALPYAEVPFFWSDQFEARVQVLGHPAEGDEVTVVHGSPDDGRFVALYRRVDRLSGVFGVTSPRLVMPFRRLLADAVNWDDAVAFAATQQT
jgi:NADPH-dependent 2,4-dienoyl-CoA reductase/sulfur reductase-like enzyme